MTILFVTTDFHGYGGVQLFSRLALRAICESFPAPDQITLVSRIDNEEQVRAGGFYGPTYVANGSMPVFISHLSKQLYSKRWDIVIIMHANIVRLLPFCPKNRCMTIIHGIEVWRKLSLLYQLGLKRSNKIISNSAHTIQFAKKFNPWLENIPVSVCHLGVATELDPVESVAPIASPYLLTIGRMVGDERYKGFTELISIWPRITKVRPDLKLILMGDGPDRKRLEELALQSSTNVSFLGRVDDITRDRYLRHCTAFALPSRGEGFGLVYLEAMRVGRPVLTGNTDAGAEVIVDGVTGRAVNPVVPEELMAGILDVTGENAERYGREGKRRFEENFTYEHFRDRFVREVRTLLELRK